MFTFYKGTSLGEPYLIQRKLVLSKHVALQFSDLGPFFDRTNWNLAEAKVGKISLQTVLYNKFWHITQIWGGIQVPFYF